MTKSDGSVVTLRDVVAGYGAARILTVPNWTAMSGFNVIIGANGSGKTTLLRVAAGILPVEQGKVELLGRDPYLEPEIRRKVGIVGHATAIPLSLTIADYLRFWGTALGMTAREQLEAVERVVSEFGLRELRSRRGYKLSRGQAQKVAIARTVMATPLLLILDEPASGLDPEAVEQVRASLLLHVQRGGSVILSTHHLQEWMGVADYVHVVERGAVISGSAGGKFPGNEVENFARAD